MSGITDAERARRHEAICRLTPDQQQFVLGWFSMIVDTHEFDNAVEKSRFLAWPVETGIQFRAGDRR